MSLALLTPDWPAPANVRAACTTRGGGVSRAPYASLNLGDHVGDTPEAVGANRRLLEQALQARPVFLAQVHGREVAELCTETPDGTQADGCTTAQRGLACTIMVADCLAVLLTDTEGAFVAAAHAGWRGLAGQGGIGIVEAVLARLGSLAANRAQRAAETMAWLGPCIGPERFEVGPEVKAAFESHDPAAAAMFRPHARDKWLADLPGLARQRLQALGVTAIHGNDGRREWCTVSNSSRFFSHRRDGVSGRLAACIWRV